MRMFDVNQLISEATRMTSSSSTLIDHILSNTSEEIYQFGIISLGLNDHCLIYATRKVVKGQINKHNTVKLRYLRNDCKQDFGLKLSALNWQDVLTSTDVTKTWERFKKYFHSVLDAVAPRKEISLKQKTEPWMATDILQCIQKRDAWLKSSEKTRYPELYQAYCKLRNKIQRESRHSKSENLANKIDENRNNPKLWQELKILVITQKASSHVT